MHFILKLLKVALHFGDQWTAVPKKGRTEIKGSEIGLACFIVVLLQCV